MYIVPDTTVMILNNVPLDNTYRDTIYFANESQQISFFGNKMKYTLAYNTYQRVNRNTIRVAQRADNLYDCNYLMFQNRCFGNKWFYAFILKAEYVNNETTEITFEIDVMQTWHFNYEVKMSFVEREMSVTDRPGDNLVPEGLEFGDYKYRDLGIPNQFNEYAFIIAATFNQAGNDQPGKMVSGVFSGLVYNVYMTPDSAADFLYESTENNRASGVVSVFMFPKTFAVQKTIQDPEVLQYVVNKNLSDIDGYKPKNNKLFTYPYNVLYVTNNEGSVANYHYEYFSTDDCQFNMSGAMCCTPEVSLTPLNYSGVSENYNEKLIVGNFPQCAYTVDTYKAWVAQNQNQLALSAINAIGTTAVGASAMYATGGAIGAGQTLSGIQQIAGLMASAADKSTLPPQARGGGGSIINMAAKKKGFQFYQAYIRNEFAQIIDNYFNVYGYATHRVKIPNRVVRPHWNYVKTRNVCLTGSVPADDMAKIHSIYDNGITFWREGNEVGDYSLDNSPSLSYNEGGELNGKST